MFYMATVYYIQLSNGFRVRTYCDDADVAEVAERLCRGYSAYYGIELAVCHVIRENGI